LNGEVPFYDRVHKTLFGEKDSDVRAKIRLPKIDLPYPSLECA